MPNGPISNCGSAKFNRAIDRLVDAIAKGRGDPAVLGPRSSVLNNERKQVAMEAIRNLVETVTAFRDPSRPRGVTVEIVGRLSALLGEQAYPRQGSWSVAENGSGRTLRS
jgi:site-specific DNA recombinase